MSKNTKQTSGRVATIASEILHDSSASAVAQRLAGSALSQRGTTKQTGAEVEHLAGRVLESSKYSDTTKLLAASVLSQTTKDRG
jgi:hypothetical protein